MPSPLDSQIVLLVATGVVAVLAGFGLGRWTAGRRLRRAVADWQGRLTQAEGARKEGEEEIQRLAARMSEIQVAAEEARDRVTSTESEADAAARELAEERQRTSGLVDELEALKVRNAELREEIETWRDEVGHLQREQLTAEENLDRLAADLTASRDRAAEIETELARFREAAREAEKTVTEQAEEAETLRGEVARLRRVKQEFQEWVQGAAASEEELGHLRRQLGEAARERDTLRDEVEGRDRRIAELERDLAESRAPSEPPPPPRPTGVPPELLDAPRGPIDDLRKIRGIGPVIERTLNALGVYHFRQIARWTIPEIEWIASHINTFPDRIARDRWVEQARDLDRGSHRSGF